MKYILQVANTSYRLTRGLLEELVEGGVELLGEGVEQAARRHVNFGVNGVVLLTEMLKHFGAGGQHFMFRRLFNDVAQDSAGREAKIVVREGTR